MGHTQNDKTRLFSRVNRIKGQLDSFVKAIEKEEDCYKVMQILASSRGALNGLIGEIMEGHIRGHIVEAGNKKLASKAGEELIQVLKSFWK